MGTEIATQPNPVYLVFFMLMMPVTLWVISNALQIILPGKSEESITLPVNRLGFMAKSDSFIPRLPAFFVAGISLVLCTAGVLAYLGL